MKYYYLIATLPDLSLEIETANINFDEIVETIERNLTNEDKQIFKYLIYPHDNRNLLNAIFKKHHGIVPLPFQRPAVFSPVIIEDYVQERYNFPDYMADFLMTFQERFSEMEMVETETHLVESFIREVSQVPEAFIKDYYFFEKHLKSMVAAFNRSLYNFHGSVSVLEETEISEKLANEGSGMSVLSQAYPFIVSLREAIHSKKPWLIEQTVDQIKWEFIDHYNKEFFSNRHVYGYVLKLFILQRRDLLEQADTKTHFERLNKQVGAFRELI